MTARSEPRPFQYRVPDEALADLRRRLAHTRLPDAPPGTPWELGTEVDYLAGLIAYWREEFDWRQQEAHLNTFAQFRLQLDDVDVHAIRVEGRGPNPVPLLLCHGWPGSVLEFLDLIPRLTDPAAFGLDPAISFTVIAPSLPGYGLSFQPGQARFGIEEIADRLAEVMKAFGHGRFFVQGGDWGSFIASRIAMSYPDNVAGIHLNMMPIRRDVALGSKTDEELAHLARLTAWSKEEAGYVSIQGTKPQTLAFGLMDSPAGLAAWLVEKFRTWSDCDGSIENAISRDHLLANIAYYWFTGSIGSSFYPYYARLKRGWPLPAKDPIDVPTGYAEFPGEINRPPRSLAEKVFSDIRQWTVMPKGGHFAALEQPELLAGDIRSFVARLRTAA